jgi:hypothetical protein
MKAMHAESDPTAAHAQKRLISEIIDSTPIHNARSTHGFVVKAKPQRKIRLGACVF